VNVLIGNADNHLKNLSFIVSPSGVELAPAYDLLSTAVYDTRGYAGDAAKWPHTPLALPVPGASTFAQVTKEGLIAAGVALGLGRPMTQRVLGAILQSAEARVAQVFDEIEAQYHQPEPGNAFAAARADDATKAGERQLLRAIRHIVIRDMLVQLASS
jgi:serine/threonine-protein kinase HipA